jgi:hypothetical protein
MIRIGFVDWFLDEWHANNYPAWIRDPARNPMVNGSRRFEVTHAWAAIDKPDGLATDAWCEKFDVQRCATIEDLVAACDAIVVLAPDHAHKHVVLADKPLRSGKPVYVDKTFATGRREAQQLFSLARAHDTPLYSTSALRYAQELHAFREAGLSQDKVSLVSTRGPGVIDSYGIHQAEMVISLMGTGLERVLMQGPAEAPTYVYAFSGGRTAVMQHLPWTGFSVLANEGESGMAAAVEKDFWGAFTDELLRFFETRQAPVPEAETVEAVTMIEAGLRASEQPGIWIDI